MGFENLPGRDTVRKQLPILMSSVNAAKTAADKAVFILGRSVGCCAANVLNRLQGKAVLLGVGDMTQMITSKEKCGHTAVPLKPWWQLDFFLCHTPTWLTWRRSIVTSAPDHSPSFFPFFSICSTRLRE